MDVHTMFEHVGDILLALPKDKNQIEQALGQVGLAEYNGQTNISFIPIYQMKNYQTKNALYRCFIKPKKYVYVPRRSLHANIMAYMCIAERFVVDEIQHVFGNIGVQAFYKMRDYQGYVKNVPNMEISEQLWQNFVKSR